MSDNPQNQSHVKNSSIFRLWMPLVLRVIVGGVFLYAGFLKIQNPQEFADSIASFHLLPDSLINLLAFGLPPLEMIAGGMMIFGLKKQIAAFAVLLLSIIFAIALGQALARGLVVDCGCFGSGKPSFSKDLFSLARDLVLIAVSAWLYATAGSPQCPP